MRHVLNIEPLYRSSVGFDRLFDLLDGANKVQSIDNWPPYDIIKTGDDSYRISMAVAGYSHDELNLLHEPNLLTVQGSKAAQQDAQYLYHGISRQQFEHRFELADHVKVVGADLKNGMLHIDLQRELPEEMKPRRIPIGTGSGTGNERPQLTSSAAPQSDSRKHAA